MAFWNKKIIEEEKPKFINPYWEYQCKANNNLSALHQTGTDFKRVIGLMNQQEYAWFTTNNPYVLASKQLNLGRDKLILKMETLAQAVAYILKLDREISTPELYINWDIYLEKINQLSRKDTDKILFDSKNKKASFNNPYHSTQCKLEKTVVEIYRKYSLQETLKFMEEDYDKWYTSNDPLVLVLNQLQLGKGHFILTPYCLEQAIQTVLELDHTPEWNELTTNWDTYFDQAIKKGGERSGKIIRIQTSEEIEEEINELLKIDLG